MYPHIDIKRLSILGFGFPSLVIPGHSSLSESPHSVQLCITVLEQQTISRLGARRLKPLRAQKNFLAMQLLLYKTQTHPDYWS